MQYIQKKSNPRCLQEWLEQQIKENGVDQKGEHINCRYEQLTKEVRAEVEEALLKDQGFLCCYTGIQISKRTCHFEHLKPRWVSRLDKDDHDDVKYENLLAAYPSGSCSFGARSRDDWYDMDLFVHPLMKQCDSKFVFDLDGNVEARQEGDIPAQTTIKKLNLNEKSLVEMRKKAIDEVLLPLSKAQLSRIVENGYSVRDGRGRYPHFCFVIEQAAKLLLHQAEKEHKKQMAIRRQKNKSKKNKSKKYKK